MHTVLKGGFDDTPVLIDNSADALRGSKLAVAHAFPTALVRGGALHPAGDDRGFVWELGVLRTIPLRLVDATAVVTLQ